MALSLQNFVLAKQRFFRAAALAAGCQGLAYAFFSWLSQQQNNLELQAVEFGPASSTEIVIANAPCTIRAIILAKATATASFFKGTDSASASSDADSELRQKIAGVGNSMGLFYPKGFAMANGFTVQGNTTASGGTGSAADGPTGVVLLSAA